MPADRLDRAFFARSPEAVAHDLIGCLLTVEIDGSCSGRIVETEAYGDATDLASHTSVYPRARAHLLAARPGTIYIYRSYGIHLCMNVVAHEPAGAGAVLIRAVEPLSGIERMMERRNTRTLTSIANGPGNVAQALGVDLSHAGEDVVAGNTISVISPDASGKVESSPRIGITRDTERLWRFFDPSSLHLSRRRVRARVDSGPC